MSFRDRPAKRREAKKPKERVAPTVFPSAKTVQRKQKTQRNRQMTTPALDTKSLGLFEQIIRIALFTGGAYLFGDATVESPEYQQAAGAVMQLAAGLWWGYRQWKVSK